MKNFCRTCAICCLDTEMIVTEKDIRIIESIPNEKYSRKDFSILVDGFKQLKNVDGHCYFLNKSKNFCTIYEFRPEGCRFYPLIYDENKNQCVIDRDCPDHDHFYQNKKEFKEFCLKLHILIDLIYKES